MTTEYLDYRAELPIRGHYDAIVCGGGPAGIGAAIAAAERGAKTLLIERFGFLGGMATAGYVDPMSEFAYNGRRITGGIPWRFATELVAAGVADFVLGLVVFGLVRWLVHKFVSFLVPQPTNALLGALSGLVKSVAACFLLSGIGFMRPGTYARGWLAQRSQIIHTFAEWADSYFANRSEASSGTEE